LLLTADRLDSCVGGALLRGGTFAAAC